MLGQVIGAKGRKAQAFQRIGRIEVAVVVEPVQRTVIDMERVAISIRVLVEIDPCRSGQDRAIRHDISGRNCTAAADRRRA